MTYDAWKLQDPWSAGFYRDDEDEEDDMTREEQLKVEGRAYLRHAQQRLADALRHAPYAQGVLQDIAAVRDALHEAAARYAELQRLEEASGADIPF